MAKRIISSLLIWSEGTVELAYATARTQHAISQKLMDGVGFAAVGFLPLRHAFGRRRESSVYYSRLYGNGSVLRCAEPPQVIREAASLARHALSEMKLSIDFEIVDAVEFQIGRATYQFRPREEKLHKDITEVRATFDSLNYDYLVIAGNRAQLQGFGKVNGDAGYNFILTVVDGDIQGGDGVDRFRLKIWTRSLE